MRTGTRARMVARERRREERWARPGTRARVTWLAVALSVPLGFLALVVLMGVGSFGKAPVFGLMFLGAACLFQSDIYAMGAEPRRRQRRQRVWWPLVRKLSARGGPTRCPYCHDALEPDDARSACDRCGVSYHEGCRDAGLGGGCATLACAGQADGAPALDVKP